MLAPEVPSLTQTIWNLLSQSAPHRMRDVIRINQVWRRRRDGAVVVVRQVHRAERTLEVSYREALDLLAYEATSWPLSFDGLQRDYDLVLSAEGRR